MVSLALAKTPDRIPHDVLFFFTEIVRCLRVALYSRGSIRVTRAQPRSVSSWETTFFASESLPERNTVVAAGSVWRRVMETLTTFSDLTTRVAGKASSIFAAAISRQQL